MGTELESFVDKPTWDDIQHLIDTNDVIVFSASWCGYSRAAKHYLSTLDVPFLHGYRWNGCAMATTHPKLVLGEYEYEIDTSHFCQGSRHQRIHRHDLSGKR